MQTEIDRDERALTLRDQGWSFSEIARALDVDGASEAAAAFNRALGRRPDSEQAWLRSREVARLDALASRLRWRDDLSVEDVVRHLHILQHQRKMLFVA